MFDDKIKLKKSCGLLVLDVIYVICYEFGVLFKIL